jgi:eukaryotic-like serine/threonine-protein kinase
MGSVSVTANTGNGDQGPERMGPYAIYDAIGSGGMATVHLGKLRSASGFTRTVAVKRMHAELARSPEFVAMFFQEARLAGRIQHPNVVAALDCLAVDHQAALIMEYVHGLSLNQLMRKPIVLPRSIASAIVVGAALGLHAAHEAVDENGINLGIVHRDVSPHNILVGVDGLARVLDFGVAKAAEQAQLTRTGEVKGKIGYMAPEQLLGERVGRQADVYSLGVVMWELLTGRRIFASDAQAQMMMKIATSQIDRPRNVNTSLSLQIDEVVMKALARSPESRFQTALQFAAAIESCIPPSGQRALGEWIAAAGKEELARRSETRARIDRSPAAQTERESEDNEFTSRYRDKDFAKHGVSRIAMIRRRSPAKLVAVATALLGAAAVATVGGAYWLRSHAGAEPNQLQANALRATLASEVRPFPVDPSEGHPSEAQRSEMPPSAPNADSVATAVSSAVPGLSTHHEEVSALPAHSDAPSAKVVDPTTADVVASRGAARVPTRPRAPKPKGSSSLQSELGAIGGRE